MAENTESCEENQKVIAEKDQTIVELKTQMDVNPSICFFLHSQRGAL